MSDNHQPERRKYTRVEFSAEITLSQGENSFQARIADLSLNGILVDTPTKYYLRADIPADVHIQLADDTEIHMLVKLIHSSSDFLGFRCESIDVDSIVHLRRLIELNIEHPNAAERVLQELVHSHEQKP